MICLSRTVTALAMVAVTIVAVGSCKKKTPEDSFPVVAKDVAAVAQDLQPWVDLAKLRGAQKEAFRKFCRFLAIRRYCDAEIDAGRMTNENAYEATQPLIDKMAKLGEPLETVLIKLLEARKGLEAKERQKTLTGENPEIFATIVLWNLKSKPAVPLFMEMARDKRIDNRAVFVRGLGRIGDPQALGLLKELARTETNLEVRVEAQKAIEAIEKKRGKSRTSQKQPSSGKSQEPKKDNK